MTPTNPTVTLNNHRHRFELETDGKISIVEFRQVDDETLALTHTEVHPDLEGKGVGSTLIKGVLEYTEQNSRQIVPLCSFVAAYIGRHPEWQHLVSKAYSVTDF
ncbi:MAG: N-acetyltransferase [Rudanella sp.]|nr:N-acetyltransferase [Rudanella sp.]